MLEQLRNLGCKEFGVETEAELDEFIKNEIPQFKLVRISTATTAVVSALGRGAKDSTPRVDRFSKARSMTTLHHVGAPNKGWVDPEQPSSLVESSAKTKS